MEIDEQKLREIMKEQKDEFERAVQVYIEHSDSNVKAVAEQYSGLAIKMDGIVEATEKLSNKVDGLEVKVDILGINVDKLEGKVDALDGRMGTLENKVDDVKRISDATFEQVGNLVMQNTELQETTKNYEQRISRLER